MKVWGVEFGVKCLIIGCLRGCLGFSGKHDFSQSYYLGEHWAGIDVYGGSYRQGDKRGLGVRWVLWLGAYYAGFLGLGRCLISRRDFF